MIPLYILAGGASSRFGSDKARAEFEGVPLIVRVATDLSPVVGPATVVATAVDSYLDLGLRTIADIVPGRGPMGGLVTALGDAAGPLFLAACDLRLPRADWARTIAGVRGTVAFKGWRGWEPLFARYERSVLPLAEGLLEGGEGSLQVLLEEVATPQPLPEGWPDEPSFNAPEELG